MTTAEKLSRSRVNGFLCAKGREIVNGKGEPILLSGWGLGNWLLCEGYMWKAGPRADRPRRIEEAVQELAGSEYTKTFWPRFRKNYIRREDILRMAELGYILAEEKLIPTDSGRSRLRVVYHLTEAGKERLKTLQEEYAAVHEGIRLVLSSDAEAINAVPEKPRRKPGRKSSK